MAVSPKPGGLAEKKDEGEQDDEDEVNLGVFSRAGPSSTNKVGERRRELRDEAATATLSTRMKRKKSVDESSDLGERYVFPPFVHEPIHVSFLNDTNSAR